MLRKKKEKPKDPNAPKQPLAKRAVREVRFWISSFAVAAAIILPLRAAVADWYDVPTGSMRPTIIEGDRIFVQNLAFGLRVPLTRTWMAKWGEPQRGDIVTFASPHDGQRLVKRIVAVPGDHLSMQEGRLALNGEPLVYDLLDENRQERLRDGRTVRAELYDEHLPGRVHPVTMVPAAPSIRELRDIVVPEGHYFMMGDNRDQSFDSRFFGFVPLRSIYGRSSHIAISLDRDRYFLPRFSRWLRRMH
jgi:signal peptidase I